MGMTKEEANRIFQEGLAAYKAGDYTTALKLWEPMAEQGIKEAQFNCGNMYLRGRGTAVDKEKALYWYLKAAEQGHAEAQALCGMMYAKGDGVGKDSDKALYWFEKAGDQGLPEARKACINVLYNRGMAAKEAGKLQDALAKLQKAADWGYADAQYELGCLYMNKESGMYNAEKVMDWLNKAADQGHTKAKEAAQKLNDSITKSLFGYSLYFMEALVAAEKKDFKRAFALYEEAAQHGEAKCQFNLGCMYYNGTATARNVTMARYWWEKAAKSDDEEAAEAARKWLRKTQ